MFLEIVCEVKLNNDEYASRFGKLMLLKDRFTC